MTQYPDTRTRFYRRSDKAMLGGVCAGIADYFGFNLAMTRLLTVLAFLFAMPMTLLAYIAAVILIPTEPGPRRDPDFHRGLRSSPRQTMVDVRSRFKSLDRRLARLEKYITSSRYELDREFRDLERK